MIRIEVETLQGPVIIRWGTFWVRLDPNVINAYGDVIGGHGDYQAKMPSTEDFRPALSALGIKEDTIAKIISFFGDCNLNVLANAAFNVNLQYLQEKVGAVDTQDFYRAVTYARRFLGGLGLRNTLTTTPSHYILY